MQVVLFICVCVCVVLFFLNWQGVSSRALQTHPVDMCRPQIIGTWIAVPIFQIFKFSKQTNKQTTKTNKTNKQTKKQTNKQSKTKQNKMKQNHAECTGNITRKQYHHTSTTQPVCIRTGVDSIYRTHLEHKNSTSYLRWTSHGLGKLFYNKYRASQLFVTNCLFSRQDLCQSWDHVL